MNQRISIVCASESSCLETISLRGALEYFGYIPLVHWLGNSKQLKDVLEGKIQLEEIILLSCHGCEKGFYAYENKLLSLDDVSVKLKNKTVLSTGCVTGKEHFAQSFLRGGVRYYIAPPDYPEGNSSMIFSLMFLWKLQLNGDVLSAWREASAILTDPNDHFRFYQRRGKRMLVDGNRETPLA